MAKRKGFINQIAAVVVGIVIVLISLAVGFAVLQATAQAVALTGAYNATWTSLWNNISRSLPLIGVVFLAALGAMAIAFLYRAFGGVGG